MLLGAVLSEYVGRLDDEQRELLPLMIHDAASGLAVPRIALRYRLQTDTHGLDRSRHRIVSDASAGGGAAHLVLELDGHGRGAPQVIGAVMAAAMLGPTGRTLALRALEQLARRPRLPDGLEVRRLAEGVPGLQPFAPGFGPAPVADDEWSGVPAERRWAMEVLGLEPEMVVRGADVHARFRRLVRLAHPDHGAGHEGAAERLAELREARFVLLAMLRANGPDVDRTIVDHGSAADGTGR
jgi:hypothetical protein